MPAVIREYAGIDFAILVENNKEVLLKKNKKN
mgnify:CR=1 FL=1